MPSLDIGNVKKDMGDTPILRPPESAELESTRKLELQKIKNIVGYDEVPESKLQFAPRWLLDEAVQKELDNYKK